jgi:hypothetical protein
MNYEELKQAVYQTAVELARKGPGWAQQAVVLREAAKRLQPRLGSGLAAEQALLTAWHDLFFERKLSWGYNLDNPDSPFFHVPEAPTALGENAALTPAGKP